MARALRGSRPVSYEVIAEGMLRGQTIAEQLETFGILKNTKYDRRRAILLKVLRVYNVMESVSGHGFQDSDFIRLPVSQDDFRKIALIIGEEEDRLKLRAAC